MSGWTVLTVRGRESQDYDEAEFNETDRWCATSDIVATMEADERVYEWTTWSSHVYAFLNCNWYQFELAEELLEEYADMVDDAVVLGANDTSDTGIARYYPEPGASHTDEYEEEEKVGNRFVGELALSVMNARYDIIARDPFHNVSGGLDESYLRDGEVR